MTEVEIDEDTIISPDLNEKDSDTVVQEKPKGKRGGKQIIVTLTDGSVLSRREYCVKRAQEGATRAEIVKELSTLEGRPVPFQVVFAATRHLKNLFPGRAAKTAEDIVV